MSTNNECMVVEYKPGQWYYVLEHYNAPKNSWDWREHASAYGSFSSEEAALRHLAKNHANPGSHYVETYHDGLGKDTVLAKLIAKATRSGYG